MHPALSIVLFTTAAGAGFGLIIVLGLGAPLGYLPAGGWFAFVALAVATALAALGLFASVFHLGRPERAWRAFSQWRSSWLSREGVCAVATFVPTAIFGIGWVFFSATSGIAGLCAILGAALAAATIYCTGMIYHSLKPVHQWRNAWVVPGYFGLGLMSGLLVLDLLLRIWRRPAPGWTLVTVLAVAAGWVIKERYWLAVDTTAGPSTPASATALGRRGRVRLVEGPHTQDNYLLKEMGFQIARKHGRRLRWIARLAGFVVPLAASVIAGLVGHGPAIAAAGLAVASAALGLVVERWLFFAEARHTVTLYYGADAV
jgi:DMSO reductase anchor subunit